MRDAVAGIVAALVVVAGAVTGGCVIFTGGSDGYKAPDAGGDAGGDGAGNSFQCASAADCGDGGAVCCVVVSTSSLSANTVCQTAPCSTAQLCKTTAECGDAGLCTNQSCTFGAASVKIGACGIVSGCTATQ